MDPPWIDGPWWMDPDQPKEQTMSKTTPPNDVAGVWLRTEGTDIVVEIELPTGEVREVIREHVGQMTISISHHWNNNNAGAPSRCFPWPRVQATPHEARP